MLKFLWIVYAMENRFNIGLVNDLSLTNVSSGPIVPYYEEGPIE